MTDFSIVPASVLHVKPMSQRMRAAGVIAMQNFDVNPRAALHRAFIASNYRRTAMIDAQPVAMWGVTGTLLGDAAVVWLVLAEKTGLIPHAIVREARGELHRTMDSYRSVTTMVLPDDGASVRFALHLGFRPTDGELWGSSTDALIDPRFRVPIGDSFVVRMGYCPQTVH